MVPEPSAVWTAVQIRAVDAHAIETQGVAGYELMQRAARAALDFLRVVWPYASRITILCGRGNNGGDGYVLAHLARTAGFLASVGAVANPNQLKGDAAQAYAAWIADGQPALGWREALAESTDLIVDAVLGTGLSREVQGEYAEAIAAMNSRRVPILSLDIPSGLDADTGKNHGVAVRATATITFIGDKTGLWLGAGPDFAGRVELADLGLSVWPDHIGAPSAVNLDLGELRTALPPRDRGAHKGRFGHVLIIGGTAGMPGAPLLAGQAALRAGAGLVTVATAPAHAAMLAAARPELMVAGVRGPADLAPLLERASVVAIGPGLGSSAWADSLWQAALGANKPLVVDADALNLLARSPLRRDSWVLTPHPGEAARLLGADSNVVQSDRFGSLAKLREKYGGAVVLKGAGTLISAPEAPVSICKAGNPGMAQGGMGDVLTGVIAGLYAQLRDPGLAARTGVRVHALAGDRAAAAGERGLSASDLIAELRACVNPA
jgi:ADP-dependent NAD(P)H-hydrate dehydratase / NAD(P)H-hydrate epimerase